MKFLLTLSSFLVIIISLLSCNSATKSKSESGNPDSLITSQDTMPTQLQPSVIDSSATIKEFQDAIEENLTILDSAKRQFEDSIAIQSDATIKRDLKKARLNITYLSNALIRSKINYLVTDMESLNDRLQADVYSASESFKKLTAIATTLTKINNGISLLVKLGKTLITKGLV